MFFIFYSLFALQKRYSIKVGIKIMSVPLLIRILAVSVWPIHASVFLNHNCSLAKVPASCGFPELLGRDATLVLASLSQPHSANLKVTSHSLVPVKTPLTLSPCEHVFTDILLGLFIFSARHPSCVSLCFLSADQCFYSERFSESPFPQ